MGQEHLRHRMEGLQAGKTAQAKAVEGDKPPSTNRSASLQTDTGIYPPRTHTAKVLLCDFTSTFLVSNLDSTLHLEIILHSENKLKTKTKKQQLP